MLRVFLEHAKEMTPNFVGIEHAKFPAVNDVVDQVGSDDVVDQVGSVRHGHKEKFF